jgi:folylpolyglutamate synthase
LLNVIPGIAGAKQAINVALAVRTLDVLQKSFPGITEDIVQKGIASASMPGRMEWVKFELKEGNVAMLLDGAHNPASCRALAEYLEPIRRKVPIVWIIGFSQGRDIHKCLTELIRKGDLVACVEFGPVDGMDWVEPVSSQDIFSSLQSSNVENRKQYKTDIRGAIRWAVSEVKRRNGMLVATGSLYLVGEIHKIRREDPEFS